MNVKLRITSTLLALGGSVATLMFITLTDLGRDGVGFWRVWLLSPFAILLIFAWVVRSRAALGGLLAAAVMICAISGLGVYLYQHGIRENNERALLPGFWPIPQIGVIVLVPLLSWIAAWGWKHACRRKVGTPPSRDV